MSQHASKKTLCILFVVGTRPELIKVAPVIQQLNALADIDIQVVSSSQQSDLIPAFLATFEISVNYDLKIMSAGQSLNSLLARTIRSLDPVITEVRPSLLVVQGDTTTALAGALAARMQHIPVAHIEAGLRTGDDESPFPEETNRRLISQIASLHCAPTPANRDNLLKEGVDDTQIILTGNPVVNSLNEILKHTHSNTSIENLLEKFKDFRFIVLTCHRRESFGEVMENYFHTLRKFVEQNPDIALVMPVHPNPAVQGTVNKVLADIPRIELIEPLDYPSFIQLLKSAWLVVSDSGGVQEEVATLGKPLLILRNNTERPEIIYSGMARLVGESASALEAALGEAISKSSWINTTGPITNPFGDEQSSARIAKALSDYATRAANPS